MMKAQDRQKQLSSAEEIVDAGHCIAIARELAGFIWDIGRHVTLAA
jgi:hypothetical protein